MDKNLKSKIDRIVKNLPDNLSQKEKYAFAKRSLGLKVKNIFTKPKVPKNGGAVNPSFKFYKPKDGTGTMPKNCIYRSAQGGKTGGKK
mgnify:CR=1 FL=1|jgi:hypothetical protein|tara:strand:+ start:857 stop:1120 length:264 start_codon:yes stop_codon:yes gene_type:complete